MMINVSHSRSGAAEPQNPAAQRDPLAGSSDRGFASSEDDLVLRANIVAIARTWLGTPYRHQGAAKHAGCDCLGLIRGVWRELYGREAEPPPPYRPDWAEISCSEPMLDAARRWLRERPLTFAEPGDVLLFRMSHTRA
jgi:cell wall-associated NlpC family hydrolase